MATKTEKKKVQFKLPRFVEWYIAALLLFILVWVIRTPSVNDFLVGVQKPDGTIDGGFVPAAIIVLIYKVATITLGAIMGMLCDRSAFPYGRPDAIVRNPDDEEPWAMGDAVAFSGACIRRAIVVGCFTFAFALAI